MRDLGRGREAELYSAPPDRPAHPNGARTTGLGVPHLRSALAAALTVGLLLSTACSESGPDATASATPTSPTADDRPQRSQADSDQDQWRSLAPLAAGPRQETAVVALDGEVWVLGGFDARGAVVRTVEVYDPASDSWRGGPDLPLPLHHANVAVTGGKLYVVGFLVGAFIASGRSFVHDPASGGWRELASMPDGTQRGGASVAVLGGEIFIAGGFRNGAVADFSAYDPVSDSWRTLPQLPRRADHVVAGAIDGLLYVAGGRSGGIDGHSASLLVFDQQRMTWMSGASMPTSRGGAASAVVDGLLYVFGGEGNAAEPSGVFDQVERYDPVADRWTSLPSMPDRRHGTGAAVVAGVIYIPGGASEQGFGAVDTNSAFAPAD